MKKKVAVYANGCAYEYAGTLLDGIEEAAKDADVDLYVFLNFTSTIETTDFPHIIASCPSEISSA